MPEEILFIQKNEVLTDAENYPLLRERGLEYLQQLSGKIWTDYNIHDPGVTMLELLCYAITDIGYRTRFSMSDLLTRDGASTPDKTNSFYTANEILTTHPVTPEDYRRLLIDIIPGLKNVWLEEIDNADIPQTNPDTTYFKPRTPGYAVKIEEEGHRLRFTASPAAADKLLHIHGLYRIKIEIEDWDNLLANPVLKTKVEETLNKVRKPGASKISLKKISKATAKASFEELVKYTLNSYRNLCEDFETVTVMKQEQVTVCADIEVQPDTDINELIKKIYRVIYNYASPSLKFYSLQEMLDKGKTIEEIYEGTVPGKGFVDYEELKTRFNKQRTVMYTSDLINLLMNLDGVIAVKKLLLTSADETGRVIHDGEKYCLHLNDMENSSFRFKRLDQHNKPANRITFFKSNLPFKAMEPGEDFVMQENTRPETFIADLPMPEGRNRGLDEYYPVQNEFPTNYYTGLDKMPQSEATAIRQNQRMQLKGYLVFFEQLLANFLAQLSNLPALFSWNDPDGFNTYAFQMLTRLTAEGETIFDADLYDPSSAYMLALNDPATNLDRRNRLLDSLLARFNEKFVDYSVFKYTHNNEPLSIDKQQSLVKDKCALLKSYAEVSANRSHAMDIYSEATLTHFNNLSGFQRYITAILGINIYDDHYLAKVLRNPGTGEAVLDSNGKPYFFDISDISFDEGFGMHMIEHILLRPLAVETGDPDNIEFLSLCCCNEDDDEYPGTDYCSDPYSMRITVVLPGWLNLSLDMEFRRFVNTVIRTNAPAHVALKICWIGMEQMYEYERTYVEFLKWLRQRDLIILSTGSADLQEYNKRLSDFVHVINNLRNVYPPATLHDCENSERDMDGNLVNRTVILNRTTLGDAWPTGLNIIPYPGTENRDILVPPFAPDPAVPDQPADAEKEAIAKPASAKIAGKKKAGKKDASPAKKTSPSKNKKK